MDRVHLSSLIRRLLSGEDGLVTANALEGAIATGFDDDHPVQEVAGMLAQFSAD